MVPPTESLRFVAGELGKCGRNLEEIGAKFLGPNRFGVFFKTLLNAFLHVHDLGHIGKLEANLSSFKTALRPFLELPDFQTFFCPFSVLRIFRFLALPEIAHFGFEISGNSFRQGPVPKMWVIFGTGPCRKSDAGNV